MSYIRKLWYEHGLLLELEHAVDEIFLQDEARLKPRDQGLNDPHLGSIDRSFKCLTVCSIYQLSRWFRADIFTVRRRHDSMPWPFRTYRTVKTGVSCR